MDTITSSPGAQRLFTASIIARLPLAMLSIGLLVHARQLTGSFALAGVVTGAYAIALGAGGPLLGHLIDRRGQTSVLLASASIAAALLVTIALLPARAPLAVLVALAAGIGLAAPPVGACLRTQLPALLSDPGAIRSAYALEVSLVELTYIFGPPVALCIGALWSSGAALAAAGLVLLAATAAFAVQPASRSWQPAPADRTSRGGSLRAPAMRTLVIVLIAVGMLLGAGEVAVIAAAKALHTTMGGAPLFAVWGAGSFIGGLLLARLGGGARTAAGLALLLGALTAGHLALIPADGNVLALGAVLLVAGAAIAPTEATLYAMVGNAAPDGTITEAFAWLATAMAVGNAAGAAGAGIVADRAGPAAAFALAGGAGALALLTSMLRSRTIGASTSPGRKPAAPIAAGSPAAGKARTGRRGDCSRPEQVTEGARRAGQIPDVDSRIAATVAHRAVEAVPLLLRDRPDAGLTRHARELAGFFEAALMCTGTDAASS
jgi:predicted MFS family arabinose efflux permease